MGNELVYLDTYVLQQDMRIRLPKTILQNMNVEKGETHFDIYLNRECQAPKNMSRMNVSKTANR